MLIDLYLRIAPAITAVEITAAAAMLCSWVWPGGQPQRKWYYMSETDSLSSSDQGGGDQ